MNIYQILFVYLILKGIHNKDDSVVKTFGSPLVQNQEVFFISSISIYSFSSKCRLYERCFLSCFRLKKNVLLMTLSTILQSQKDYFYSEITLDIHFRIEQLKKLKKLLQQNESSLFAAIYQDFKKGEWDTFVTELAMIYQEIDFFVKNISTLSKPKRVATAITSWPGKTRIHKDPLGVVLVIGAWNYPFQLTLIPMISAMAAGNTCIIKPSELPYYSSKIIADLINQSFPNAYLYVAEGGAEKTQELLQLRFDFIFFTGSTRIGKIVYQEAAKQLIPVVLELGGKSPAIVSSSAQLEVAVKRIVWGKFINAGQTCIAPDFVWVHQSVEKEFTQLLIRRLKEIPYTESDTHYTQIINSSHFDRLMALIDTEKVVYGGNSNRNKRYIEPTIMTSVSWEDAVMQDEIFGPILPILSFDSFSDVIQQLVQREKSLAAYLFTTSASEIQTFTKQLSFGGGCINDTLMHIANNKVPFGGVGRSGIGHYHGKFGFQTFSHLKPILYRPNWGEPSIKYPPYTASKFRWLKKIF